MYYENSDLFARDLTEAAEEGQLTGDFSRYHNIQRTLAAETAAALLSPYANELSALARERALKEVEAKQPGFRKLLEENRTTLKEERPKLLEAVEYAESDPRLQEDLLQLYDSCADYIVTRRSRGTQTRNARTQHSRDLSTSASRRHFIQEFEAKYGDVEIDQADTSENVVRIR